MSGLLHPSARNRQPGCIKPGEWPDRRGRGRVLIETPHEDYRSEHAQVLRAAGYDVATCAGPTAPFEEHRRLCPLVEHGRCPLVDEADVVVSTTQLSNRLEILSRLTARSRPAVVVEGTRSHLERDRDVLGDATLLPFPVTSQDLLAAVAAAHDENPATP